MNNFNPLNFMLNNLNNLNLLKQQNAGQNASAAANSAQTSSQIAQPNMFSNTTFSPNLYPQTQAQDAQSAAQSAQNAALNAEKTKMDNEVVQKYLQNLMDMPESIDKFIEQAQKGDSKSYQFLKIFIENMISTKALATLLNQNSKEAIQKLLVAISNTLRQGGGSANQLKELLSVLSSIQNSTNVSSNAVKELLLLYIPINYQIIEEEGSFGKIQEEFSEAINQSSLSILFETVHFSNVLITLDEDMGSVFLQIYGSENFPKEKFKTVVDTLSKEISVKSYCDFVELKSQNTDCKKQNFKVFSNEYVSTNVLLVSYIAIKTVFKLDSNLE